MSSIGRARKAVESAAQTLTLRGLHAKRKSKRLALAFPGMDVTILHNLISRATNAVDLGEYLTEEIRKLTDARCVSLTQCLKMPTEIAHRLVSINPVRRRGWAESADARRLYDTVHHLPSMQVWRTGDNSEVTRLLEQQGYDLSVAIPLRVGAFHVGAILVLGLPNEMNLDSKVKLLDTLSTITALVLYSAFLYEKQEELIRDRTAGLQKANEQLRVEASERKRMEEELRRQEKHFRALIERSSDVIVILDRNGTARYVSPSVEHALGITRAQSEGAGFLTSIHPDDVQQVAESWDYLLKHPGGTAKGERRVRRPDGSWSYVEAIGYNLLHDPAVEGVVVNMRDINERKKAEEALRQARDRAQEYLDIAGVMLVVIDKEGDITLMNRKGYAVLGYEEQDLIGKNWFDTCLPAHFRDEVQQVFRGLLAGEIEPLEYYENPVLTRLGEERIIAWHNRLLTDEAGNITGTLSSGEDITERKKAEEALRESERQIKLLLDKTQESRNALLSILEDEKKAEKAQQVSEQRFTTAFHASPAMMTIVSLKDQRYIEVNRAFEEITGYRPDEVIGRTLSDMAIWYEAEEAVRALQDMAAKGGHRNLEARFRTKTGESRVALLSTGVVELDGEACMLTTGEDITERKEAETRKRKALEEIALAGRLASVGRLASGIAHEINNPLSAVIGYAQLLMEKDVPKDIKEDLEAIDDNAQRVAKIVKGLLTFARGSKPGRDYVDMNTLVSKTLGLRDHEMSIHNIEVVTRLAPDLPQILADQSQMQQVFLNIILNAEQSMTKAHNGGHLEVKTTRVGDHVRVAFKDDGLGIAKEHMARLFEPFFTTKEVGEGTGLGLSISYGIVQEHGGRIYARGRSGPGAIFVVELPIVAKPDRPESSEEEVKEPERKVNGKVLVVDDEPAICQLLAGVLTREGHSVDTVGDAESALEKMQRERFGVVLLDIRMRGMDGFKLYEQMGKIAQSLQKRVIFITGDTLAPDTQGFLAKTESPYIGKPFDLQQLRNMVNERLASG